MDAAPTHAWRTLRRRGELAGKTVWARAARAEGSGRSGVAQPANKTALITGGTSPFGLATARLFRADGARVAITGTDANRLKAAQRLLGGDIMILRAETGDLRGHHEVAHTGRMTHDDGPRARLFGWLEKRARRDQVRGLEAFGEALVAAGDERPRLGVASRRPP